MASAYQRCEGERDEALARLATSEARCEQLTVDLKATGHELLQSVTQQQHQAALDCMVRFRSKYHAARRELRRMNATVRLCNLQEIARSEATRDLGTKHRAKLAEKDAEYDRLAQANNDNGMRLTESTREPSDLRTKYDAATEQLAAVRGQLRTGTPPGACHHTGPVCCSRCNKGCKDHASDQHDPRCAVNGVAELQAALAKCDAVVGAARGVLAWILTTGRIENHGHRKHPGGCIECRELTRLGQALSALDQPSQGEPEKEPESPHTCPLAATTTGVDCKRCQQLGIHAFTVEPAGERVPWPCGVDGQAPK